MPHSVLQVMDGFAVPAALIALPCELLLFVTSFVNVPTPECIKCKIEFILLPAHLSLHSLAIPSNSLSER